jgi:hypothetical protein
VFEEVWQGMGGVLQEGAVDHHSWRLLKSIVWELEGRGFDGLNAVLDRFALLVAKH